MGLEGLRDRLLTSNFTHNNTQGAVVDLNPIEGVHNSAVAVINGIVVAQCSGRMQLGHTLKQSMFHGKLTLSGNDATAI